MTEKKTDNVINVNFRARRYSKETFDDVAKVSRELAAWNRMCIWRNLCADFGMDAAQTYLSQFNKREKDDIDKVLDRIMDKGEIQTRKDVMGKVKFLGEC